MNLALLFIILGIALAFFVHYTLGIFCIIVGIVLLIWPVIASNRAR